ncbi:hypothetical protein BKA70DRAFT_1494073 [Coprinopsis sp. MPI-PUGE-AT-0042]|nr:hypothetical protein BKA70DRAFT_1494073 [Coprinopsis sp. MPI-PUGE-AT-0042]
MSSTSEKRAFDNENQPPPGAGPTTPAFKDPASNKANQASTQTATATNEAEQHAALEEERQRLQKEIDERERQAKEAEEEAEMASAAGCFRPSLKLLGEAGFPDVFSWMKTFWTNRDQHLASHASRFTAKHGTDILDYVYSHEPEMVALWTQIALGASIREEGERLIKLLAPPDLPLSEILSKFLLDKIIDQVKEAAPLLYFTLALAIQHHEGDSGGRTRNSIVEVTAGSSLHQEVVASLLLESTKPGWLSGFQHKVNPTLAVGHSPMAALSTKRFGSQRLWNSN